MQISDIPTGTFNAVLTDLRAEEWKTVSEYAGFDAWIDSGLAVLKKQGVKLEFEWEPYFEGKVQGPVFWLQQLKNRCALTQQIR